MKTKLPEKNEFVDINQLPKDEGILLFPLSMSRLENAHGALNIIKALHHFGDKINYPRVGVNFLYTDFLYLFSEEKASKLKRKFTESIFSHSNAIKNLIHKDRFRFQIEKAFFYMTWSEMYLLSRDFNAKLLKLEAFYSKDKVFQKYLKEEAKRIGKRFTKNQIDFFLEEYLFAYLAIKGYLKFPNHFIEGREKWLLFCYPGMPPKSLIYLFQKNFFKLPKVQKYEGQYNLETNQYIDYHNVDLETYSVK